MYGQTYSVLGRRSEVGASPRRACGEALVPEVRGVLAGGGALARGARLTAQGAGRAGSRPQCPPLDHDREEIPSAPLESAVSDSDAKWLRNPAVAALAVGRNRRCAEAGTSQGRGKGRLAQSRAPR